MFTHRYIPPHNIRGKDDHLLRANDAYYKGFITSKECDQCHFGTLNVTSKGNLIINAHLPHKRETVRMTKERADWVHGCQLLEI